MLFVQQLELALSPINNVHTKLVPKFIMAFGSPELAGIPRLAQIVFMVTDNPQQNSHKKSIGSIHRLCTVLFALSIHFLWQFHRP